MQTKRKTIQQNPLKNYDSEIQKYMEEIFNEQLDFTYDETKKFVVDTLSKFDPDLCEEDFKACMKEFDDLYNSNEDVNDELWPIFFKEVPGLKRDKLEELLQGGKRNRGKKYTKRLRF